MWEVDISRSVTCSHFIRLTWLHAGCAILQIAVWSLSTGDKITQLDGHKAGLNVLVFTPDGLGVISGGYDRTVRYWNVSTSEESRRIDIAKFSRCNLKSDAINAICFSRDGKFIAVDSHSQTRIFDVQVGDGEWVRTLSEGHTDRVTCTDLARTSTGGIMVSGGEDGTVRFWDEATGRGLGVIQTTTRVVDLSFSGDGKVLAAALYHETVLLIDTGTRQKFREISVAGRAAGVSMSSDGTKLAVALWNKDVQVFKLTASTSTHDSESLSRVLSFVEAIDDETRT